MKVAVIIVAIICLVAGIWTYTRQTATFDPDALVHASYLYDQKVAIPTFEFIDHNKQAFSAEQIKDRWTLWFFGFTYCPDICPQTLGLLSATLNKLETDFGIDDVSIIFVSVDPERDTPEQIKAYVTAFNPKAIGITAQQTELDKFLQNMGVIAVKINDEGSDNYTFDHSSAIYLIAPDTGISALFSSPHTVEGLTQDIASIRAHYLEK